MTVKVALKLGLAVIAVPSSRRSAKPLIRAISTPRAAPTASLSIMTSSLTQAFSVAGGRDYDPRAC